MNLNQANEYIKDQLEYYLHLKGIDTNNKFRCLNPDHIDEHPSMSIDRTSRSGPHCKCFACDAYYDTFDLIGIDFGLTNNREIFQKAYDFFSLQVDTKFKTFKNAPEKPKNARKSSKWYFDLKSIYASRIKNISKTEIYDHHSSNNFPPLKVKKESTFLSLKNNCEKVESSGTPLRGSRIDFKTSDDNFTRNMINSPKNAFKSEIEAYEKSHYKIFSIDKVHKELLNNLSALNHYENRGLSLDIIKKYKLGYAEGGYNSLLKDYKEFWSCSRKADLYKYVFPYFDTDGKCTYFLTEIADRSQIDDYNGKYRKISKGKSDIESQIFNERYLKLNTPSVIFICEGIYDALSVEEVGGFAVVFVGTAHRRFLSLCEKYNPDTTFVISLDNDKAGKDSAERVMNGLGDLGIQYIVKPPTGKDFNDDLVSNRESLSKYIQDSIKEAEHKLNELQKEYIQQSVQNDLKEFKRKIRMSNFNFLELMLK